MTGIMVTAMEGTQFLSIHFVTICRYLNLVTKKNHNSLVVATFKFCADY